MKTQALRPRVVIARRQLKNFRLPAGNKAYWMSKIEGNVARDKRNPRKLRRGGWQVFTVRECMLSNEVKMKQRLLRPTLPVAQAPQRRGALEGRRSPGGRGPAGCRLRAQVDRRGPASVGAITPRVAGTPSVVGALAHRGARGNADGETACRCRVGGGGHCRRRIQSSRRSLVETVCRRGKCWQQGDQLERWVGSALWVSNATTSFGKFRWPFDLAEVALGQN